MEQLIFFGIWVVVWVVARIVDKEGYDLLGGMLIGIYVGILIGFLLPNTSSSSPSLRMPATVSPMSSGMPQKYRCMGGIWRNKYHKQRKPDYQAIIRLSLVGYRGWL